MKFTGIMILIWIVVNIVIQIFVEIGGKKEKNGKYAVIFWTSVITLAIGLIIRG